MMSALGVFDSVKASTTSANYINTPIVINTIVEQINKLLYFLFPSIIGASIYRDYKYNVHHLLYSYSFTKTSYLLGKFLSAFLITFIISVCIGLGLYLATLIPLANPQSVGPNIFWNYAQVYLLNILPNMLFIGVIVFVVTTLSRSVYIGFVTVIILTVLQGILGSLTGNMDNKVLAALLDPSGSQAIKYYTQYWTIDDYNNMNLPIEKWFILNRTIWLGVTGIFLLFLGKWFSFSQSPISFGKKAKSERVVKNNFVGLTRIVLPKVNYDFSLKSQLQNIVSFTKFDFKYIVKNKVFLILVGLGILMMVLVSTTGSMVYGTSVYPVTRIMLELPGATFQFFAILITFLAAGQLVHRAAISKMDHLIDASPVSNGVLFASKTLALILVQLVLWLVIIFSGIAIQSYHGFYDFEIGLYLKALLGINWIWYIIWAGLAIAVQTFFKNYLIAFFVLLVFFLFGDQISNFGIEQNIFFFNRLPYVSYSDMNGFGSVLPKYFTYSLYWCLFIGFLSGLTLLFWRRGVSMELKNRFYYAKKRAKAIIVIPTAFFFVGFIGLGAYLYYENTVLNTFISSKDLEQLRVDYELQYKRYENLVLPRITDVKVDVDIYPNERDFEARGIFTLTNKNAKSVDSLLIRYDSDMLSDIQIDGAEFLSTDTLMGFSFYRFKQPLDSGEMTNLNFTIKNRPNTCIRSNSPILENGTFISNSLFPALGYSADGEISDNRVRKKYNLPMRARMAQQSDKEALKNTYISNDADWISFETTVSTSTDQIAIAPGYLQDEWIDGDRRYFHYKMDQKMLNFYAFNSARYEVLRDKWKDINIEIYYHKGHEFNIERMAKGVKEGLKYFTENFSPYQHKQVRILEFPNTMGSFAQSFANTIPYSEAIGFIAAVDEEDDNAVDYPFSVTAHEVAHQWWAHQVIGANVQGATMLSESLAEYSSLKVLEHEYGKGQMRKFLRIALDDYLSQRSFETMKEQPLMYNENQQYIHYQKGSLIFYALSDYLGESKMNKVLSDYIKRVAFQDAPYTTASELVDDLRDATPDSLKYLIKDMFETITLYDNYIDEASVEKTADGKYKVNIKAIVSKYRADDKGKKIFEENGAMITYDNKGKKEIQSLPLADYIDLAIFGKSDEKGVEGKILYLQKVKISQIENDFTIIVDEEPMEVGIDPYNKLIDTRSIDNRKKVTIQ